MYLLEVTLTNLLKKEIRVKDIESALIFINDFENFSSNSVISVGTTNGIFAIRKGSIFSIDMKECN